MDLLFAIPASCGSLVAIRLALSRLPSAVDIMYRLIIDLLFEKLVP